MANFRAHLAVWKILFKKFFQFMQVISIFLLWALGCISSGLYLLNKFPSGWGAAFYFGNMVIWIGIPLLWIRGIDYYKKLLSNVEMKGDIS